MGNLIEFLRYFVSYLSVFLLIVFLVVLSCVIGIKWRKSKDARAAAAASSAGDRA